MDRGFLLASWRCSSCVVRRSRLQYWLGSSLGRWFEARLIIKDDARVSETFTHWWNVEMTAFISWSHGGAEYCVIDGRFVHDDELQEL
ncbi:unnamed protein product [Microthlaspi erraticum]|uniref:Uncharacterized protein n=1 Tax=Microthlaspi erraticum TaxID=1685480 RepID=A0A6D2HZX6_9BRAS|nr:unnamed protein product [Microthlaspi erraticum]